ncbi:DUF1758 domain-containing protein [Trichonephila clavipes]|nr:DUF1758 domain-containing protein [Trichonephila clavipes]
MGAVLTQLTEQGEEHPILYLSKKFSEVEKRYCTTEKECASIVFAIKRLHYYLDGNSFLVMTDHNPLVWLNRNVSSNPRLMRWALALQPYNFRIVHRSEVGKPIDEYSACVEVGTTHKHLRRGDNSNNFNKYFSSNDITCEEVKSVDSQRFFIGYIVRASNKGARKKRTKIELAKLQLAKLEKEIELQLAKNKALSLNPAAKVEEKQFETNIENMIKSIKTLSLPVPTRSENFNLFFQSLERAFLTKKINDEYKSEILINLLGERAHNVLLYIKEEELNDYEKLKSIVLREFQLTPRECLNSFKNAVKSSGETYIQFAARLTANFQYYCSLRKVNSFESLCDLIISDKLFETLNKETATHIGIREAEDWFRPIDLAKECDIYISSRSGSHKEIPITYGYTQDPFKIDHKTLNQRLKRTIPNILKEKIKIALYAVIHLIAQETVRSVLNLKNLMITSIIE